MTPKESPIVLNEEVMLAMKCSMPGGGAAASAHLSGLLWQPSRTLHSLASISARSQHPSELPPSAASSSFMSFKLIEDTSITMCFLFNFCFCSARCRPPKQILLWGSQPFLQFLFGDDRFLKNSTLKWCGDRPRGCNKGVIPCERRVAGIDPSTRGRSPVILEVRFRSRALSMRRSKVRLY